MRGKSCFFIGHKETSYAVLPLLTEAVEYHIMQLGVTEFIVGRYGGFDRMAVNAVVATKQRHPEIVLLSLLPYHPAECPAEKPAGFDSLYYPPEMEKVPHKFAIARANRYVVDHVEYLIAHVWHPASNAGKLLAYAQKREARGLIRIQNLGADCHTSVRAGSQ